MDRFFFPSAYLILTILHLFSFSRVVAMTTLSRWKQKTMMGWLLLLATQTSAGKKDFLILFLLQVVIGVKKQCNFSGLEGGGERKKHSGKHLYNVTLIFRERRGPGVLF